MKKLGLVSMFVVGAAMAGCGGITPIMGKPAGGGSLYSDVQFNDRVTDNPVGAKQGQACASNILGIIATGDTSAATAAKSAGITKIGAIDGQHSNILSFYGKYCTSVVGE
jgi:hypothetical protein